MGVWIDNMVRELTRGWIEFNEYLIKVKNHFSKIKKVNKGQVSLNIVLGNESSDLDSFVSAVTFSYKVGMSKAGGMLSPLIDSKHFRELMYNYAEKKEYRIYESTSFIFPVICTSKELFKIRGDCIYSCYRHNLAIDDGLIFIDELENTISVLVEREVYFSLNITLVDQPNLPIRLTKKFASYSPKCFQYTISKIIDHHQPVTIPEEFLSKKFTDVRGLVGSNCTLIAELYKKDYKKMLNLPFLPPTIFEMLLEAILIDTDQVSLKADNIKTTTRDVMICLWLAETVAKNRKKREKYYNGIVQTQQPVEVNNNLSEEVMNVLNEIRLGEKKVQYHSDEKGDNLNDYYAYIHQSLKKAKAKFATNRRTLSSSTALLVDYKVYDVKVSSDSSYTYGISSLGMPLHDWILLSMYTHRGEIMPDSLQYQGDYQEGIDEDALTKARNQLKTFASDQSIDIQFIMTAYTLGDKRYRELGIGIPINFINSSINPTHEDGLKFLGDDLVKMFDITNIEGYYSMEDKKGGYTFMGFKITPLCARKTLQPELQKRLETVLKS